MSENKEEEVFDKKTKNILSTTLTKVVQGVTGVLTSDKNDLILSLSHIFQKIRGGQFLSVLLDEWNRYEAKGKIKEDYQFTEQHKVCLQELLEFLDKDSPDEVRFRVIKQIFLVAASEEVSDRNSLLPQQFMKIARSLSSGEVVLLKTTWVIANEKIGLDKNNKDNHATEWIANITKRSGLQFTQLVEIHEKGLMDKRLLTIRQLGDSSGVLPRPYYRLTELGYEFCNFIEKYDE